MEAQLTLELLLAEDDEGHALLLERALRRGGVRNGLRHFRDGEDLLTFLRRAAEEGEVRGRYLVLVDVQMPRLGGLGLLREFRADPRFRDLPVLVLSSAARAVEAEEACRLGAPVPLVKPLCLDGFLAAVEEVGCGAGIVRG